MHKKSMTHLILGRVADKALGICERHIAGRGTVARLVCDDLNTVVLPDANAAVGRAKIDTDRLAGNLQAERMRMATSESAKQNIPKKRKKTQAPQPFIGRFNTQHTAHDTSTLLPPKGCRPQLPYLPC